MIGVTLNSWMLFTIFFGLLLIITFFMQQQAKQFYTKDPVKRKFSILELEIPASAAELINLITGLYKLPHADKNKAINALKGQLKLDFAFMIFAYGSIFLLCWRVAHKMESSFGYIVFMAFAFLQIIPWICDIIENVYLLGKIKPDNKDLITMNKAAQNEVEKKHKRYLLMEAAKWGIALIATVCAVSAACYFWLAGYYSPASSFYLLIVVVEIIVFGVISYKMQKR